jgi:hypothetical protein
VLIKNKYLGEPTEILDRFNKKFIGIIQEAVQDKSNKTSAIFTTIGKRSNLLNLFKIQYLCPYKKEPFKYNWPPEDCANIEIAITRSTKRRIFYKPTPEYKQAIITRLNKPAWKNLKKKFEKKYNRKIENLKSGSEEFKPKYPGNITAVVIDSILIIQGPGEEIYAIFDFLRYLFLESILIDNYGATYLINNISLLVPDSFVKTSTNESMEAGSSALPIIRREIVNLDQILLT